MHGQGLIILKSAFLGQLIQFSKFFHLTVDVIKEEICLSLNPSSNLFLHTDYDRACYTEIQWAWTIVECRSSLTLASKVTIHQAPFKKNLPGNACPQHSSVRQWLYSRIEYIYPRCHHQKLADLTERDTMPRLWLQLDAQSACALAQGCFQTRCAVDCHCHHWQAVPHWETRQDHRSPVHVPAECQWHALVSCRVEQMAEHWTQASLEIKGNPIKQMMQLGEAVFGELPDKLFGPKSLAGLAI